MNGLKQVFWAACAGFCQWCAEIALGRSKWWAEQAAECNRRARG